MIESISIVEETKHKNNDEIVVKIHTTDVIDELSCIEKSNAVSEPKQVSKNPISLFPVKYVCDDSGKKKSKIKKKATREKPSPAFSASLGPLSSKKRKDIETQDKTENAPKKSKKCKKTSKMNKQNLQKQEPAQTIKKETKPSQIDTMFDMLIGKF